MIEFGRNKRPVREINLISMVDVVMLLLIFFLISGTLKEYEVVDVEIPSAVSGEVLDQGHIKMVLGRYDEIIINDAPVMLDDITPVMARELEHNKDRVITIKADARMKASRMIAVMDRIKAAGGQNVSLITQQF